MNGDTQELFNRARSEGKADCPCCDQRVQFYRRRLNSAMVRVLIHIYLLTRTRHDRSAHVEEFRPSNGAGDYAKMRFWGLLEPLSSRSNEANANGRWRITEYGEAFVESRSKAWPVVFVYNNTGYGSDTTQDMLTISEALQEPFDYRKLVTP